MNGSMISVVSVSVSRLSVKRCTVEDLPKFTVSWSGLPAAHFFNVLFSLVRRCKVHIFRNP